MTLKKLKLLEHPDHVNHGSGKSSIVEIHGLAAFFFPIKLQLVASSCIHRKNIESLRIIYGAVITKPILGPFFNVPWKRGFAGSTCFVTLHTLLELTSIAKLFYPLADLQMKTIRPFFISSA